MLAIIALVISLTLPSLGFLRREAQQLRSLSNLRSHAAIHAAYAGDYADSFLYVCDPEATATILRGGGATVSIGYWELTQSWNVAMVDEYYSGAALPESLLVPWKPVLHPHTFYQYVCSFFARPEYWRPETRLADRSQWRRTTFSEVSYPSAKGLIWERGVLAGSDGVFRNPADARMAFADGSAIETQYSSLLPFYAGEWPVFSTLDGVRGRDVAGR